MAYLLGMALLACAGGWALPMIGLEAGWSAQWKQRSSGGLLAGLAAVFAFSLGMLWISEAPQRTPSAVAPAAQVLATLTGGNGLLVAAPGQETEELIAGSGVQALLASPERVAPRA